MIKRHILATCLAVAAVIAADPAFADRSIQEQCELGRGGEVDVEVLSGKIDVSAGNAGEVLVTGTIGDDVEELIVDCQGGHVTIEVQLPDKMRGNVDADANLHVEVPADALVAVTTVSADIEARDLAGSVELQSVSGNVDIQGDLESIEAASVSGNVEIDGRSEDIEVESVSGQVVVASVSGRLEASSVSGDVRILSGTVREGSIESVSGDVVSKAGVASGGRMSVESHSGDVRIDLPAGSGASVKVETFSGRISNSLTSDRAEDEDVGPGSSLSFDYGGGGGRVHLETFSGSVYLGSQ